MSRRERQAADRRLVFDTLDAVGPLPLPGVMHATELRWGRAVLALSQLVADGFITPIELIDIEHRRRKAWRVVPQPIITDSHEPIVPPPASPQ